MAKFQISFAKYIPRPNKPRLEVSPQEKFNRLAKRLSNKGDKFKLRRFHFNVIESGKTIIVFNGEGLEVAQRENSHNGYKDARLHCLHLFLASDNQNGGFSFTVNTNLEYQSLDELRNSRKMVQKNLDYAIEREIKSAPIKCNHCFFEFSNEPEFNQHQCIHGAKGWIVFEFAKVALAA